MELLAALDAQRRHVLGIVEGLDEEALHRPVLPSGWTFLGLINHLALDVERFWFRAVVAGQRTAIAELDASGDAWKVGTDMPAHRVLDDYRRQIDLANAVITTTAEDAAPAWWPGDQFGDWRMHTHREVLLHAITETACHAGHLDAARELLDGRQWLAI
ncbi:DinB family protein [Streptomyces sp. B6B3]|uniref:DinB family protein n=1 Tax=Streptomyces sp. B6B3 TaxID=3153570 RepID=UPI00325F298A